MILSCEQPSATVVINRNILDAQGHQAKALTLQEITSRGRTWVKPAVRNADEALREKALAAIDCVSQEVLERFFTAIGDGRLASLKNFLRQHPDLAYISGNLVDVTNRKFERFSAFQYAWWAGDVPMCELILKYLPDWVAAYQVKLLKESRRELCNPLFSFNSTLKAYDDYCSYCFNHPKASTLEKSKRWQQGVGGVQLSWPAWIRYKFTEIGREAVWPQMAVGKIYYRQLTESYTAWNEILASGEAAMYRNRASKAYAISYLGSHGGHPLDKMNLDAEHGCLTRYRKKMMRFFKQMLTQKNLW